MDRRHGRPHSHSSPSLHHRDGAPNASEAATPSSRTNSQSALAPHVFAQPDHAHGGQTWVDFLRESGPLPQSQRHPQTEAQLNMNRRLPPLPHENYSRDDRFVTTPRPHSSETNSSTERKRRLMTGEQPMRRPEGRRTQEGSAGPSSSASGSAADPIVLDSPPPPQQNFGQLQHNFGQGGLEAPSGPVRRGSEFVLPPWQPDASVTHCFVCGSQFTFFYRKHHCRKCGRVVCAACSPHRITIPRQFIVHPTTENANMIDLTADDDDNAMSAFGPFRNPALGGGEEVRVCNPCVPDPNYGPPPPYSPGQASNYAPFSPSLNPSHSPGLSSFPGGRPRGHRASQSVNDGAQTIGHGQLPRLRDPFSDRRVSYQSSTSVADLWPPTRPPSSGQVHGPAAYMRRPSTHSRPVPTSSSSTPTPPPSHPQIDARSMTPSMIRRLAYQQGNFPPSFPVPAPSAPPPPRRQIPEEDECPICGNELPPKGPNGEDAERVQHVESCIAIHSGSPAPAAALEQTTSQSLPAQRTRGMSNAAEGAASSSRGNRLSMSARGMYPYVATEKDCLDEQGDEAECVICFEEFEAGARMARLVCWCKFHEECIRQWWEKKGRGACPTHQLQY